MYFRSVYLRLLSHREPLLTLINFFSVVVFACLGFLSPANRGSLMTCSLVLYVCLGTPAGYVSARIYKSKSNLLYYLFIAVYENKTFIDMVSLSLGEKKNANVAICTLKCCYIICIWAAIGIN